MNSEPIFIETGLTDDQKSAILPELEVIAEEYLVPLAMLKQLADHFSLCMSHSKNGSAIPPEDIPAIIVRSLCPRLTDH